MSITTEAQKRCPKCGSDTDLKTEIVDIIRCENCDTFARIEDVQVQNAY
jgi:predicted  nucleic acid-binding Zn ribbon protein